MRIKPFILLLLLGRELVAGACQKPLSSWRTQIDRSPTLEQFFETHEACQREFYPHLTPAERIYFDTVTYPKGLSPVAYQNRWRAMGLDDRAFFQEFRFFNNYFMAHRNTLSAKQLSCFEHQYQFESFVPKERFFQELEFRGMSSDVAYLYPLIRWSYMNYGRDMHLSSQRVERAERTFGAQRGKIGDKEQFARYLALFDREYQVIAKSMAQRIGMDRMEAYKILVVLTYLESRGNLFAVSSTGAFGPLQLTMHYYLLYGTPNKPFDPKSSLAKLANKFVHYAHIGKGIDASVIAYKSGTLQKCQEQGGYRDVDCRYYDDFKRLTSAMQNMNDKREVVAYLTGHSYFGLGSAELKRLYNPKGLKAYEPDQYAVLKGAILRDQAQEGQLLNGQKFLTLGKMKRSEIYELQRRYGTQNIGVISDKKVCY